MGKGEEMEGILARKELVRALINNLYVPPSLVENRSLRAHSIAFRSLNSLSFSLLRLSAKSFPFPLSRFSTFLSLVKEERIYPHDSYVPLILFIAKRPRL